MRVSISLVQLSDYKLMTNVMSAMTNVTPDLQMLCPITNVLSTLAENMNP